MPKRSERTSPLKILSSPDLTQEAKSVFLDTNIFVAATGSKDFLAFLKNLKDNHGFVYFTIPQVVYEFTRGSNSIDTYNKRAEFIDHIVDAVYPIDRHIDYSREFIVLMQKYRPRGQYTDFLLCICLYTMQSAYLLTSDHSAMPLEVFEREFFVSTDNTKEFQNIGLYKIDEQRLDIELEKLLS